MAKNKSTKTAEQPRMTKGRLEGFSDGVIAVAITIMVLELHPPHSGDFSALRELLPNFGAYVLSFIYVGIYWNDHHHRLQVVQNVDGAILWANLHLLFWLTLIPFATAWAGQNFHRAAPVALYGVVLMLAGTANNILVRVLIRRHGENAALAKAIGSNFKGKVSLVVYAVAVALSLVTTWASFSLYALVAFMWFVPDRRVERLIDEG